MPPAVLLDLRGDVGMAVEQSVIQDDGDLRRKVRPP
jgi:hypothetical protein